MKFDGDGITTLDWESYPILRFSEVPEISTVIVHAPTEPTLGMGECTFGPTAAAIGNAQAFLQVRADFKSFDEYVWQFVGGAPVVRRRRSQTDVPAVTPLAEKLSADLRARGFKFVGPTIVYSFMQAVGLANDHLTRCFRFAELSKTAK